MAIDRAQSRLMDAMGERSALSAAERGKEIRRRRIRLGIKSYEQFHEATGVSRKAITAAENGRAGATTYERLETWLDGFEEETGANDPPAEAGRVVTFEAKGVFGIAQISVAGPVEDGEETARLFAELITKLREGGALDRPDGGDAPHPQGP